MEGDCQCILYFIYFMYNIFTIFSTCNAKMDFVSTGSLAILTKLVHNSSIEIQTPTLSTLRHLTYEQAIQQLVLQCDVIRNILRCASFNVAEPRLGVPLYYVVGLVENRLSSFEVFWSGFFRGVSHGSCEIGEGRISASLIPRELYGSSCRLNFLFSLVSCRFMPSNSGKNCLIMSVRKSNFKDKTWIYVSVISTSSSSSPSPVTSCVSTSGASYSS